MSVLGSWWPSTKSKDKNKEFTLRVLAVDSCTRQTRGLLRAGMVSPWHDYQLSTTRPRARGLSVILVKFTRNSGLSSMYSAFAGQYATSLQGNQACCDSGGVQQATQEAANCLEATDRSRSRRGKSCCRSRRRSGRRRSRLCCRSRRWGSGDRS